MRERTAGWSCSSSGKLHACVLITLGSGAGAQGAHEALLVRSHVAPLGVIVEVQAIDDGARKPAHDHPQACCADESEAGRTDDVPHRERIDTQATWPIVQYAWTS